MAGSRSCIAGLRCDDCAAVYSDREPITTCPACGGFLDTEYDWERLRATFDVAAVLGRPRGLWRWRELLPVRDLRHVVTLGEGSTPLHRADLLAARLGLRAVWLKDDTIGPTGSLKDRSFAVAMSKAVEVGVRRAFTYSSGNAGASFSAYAARAGLDALVLVDERASDEKLAALLAYGHRVVRLSFTSFAEVTDLIGRASRDLGLYQFTNFVNPFRHEGMKAYAYEIWEDLGRRAPDRVIHPVGTGGGLFGDWKGFEELRRLGLVERVPRLTAVQPEATPGIVEAFRAGRPSAVPSGDNRRTIAQSIAADAPLGGGRRALRAIRGSGGTAVAVSDAELLDALRVLGREGVFAEPAGAAAVAGLTKLVALGEVDRDEEVVCVITGTGLKQPKAALGAFARPETRPARLDALAALVAGWP